MTRGARRSPAERRPEVLLEVESLGVVLGAEATRVRAVDGVDLSLNRGEVLAIVGESGSGKTALCLSLLGLLPVPTGRPQQGKIRFSPEARQPPLDLVAATPKQLRTVRGRHIAMVFQDPMTALNPYLRIGVQVGEALAHHRGVRGEPLARAVHQALVEVGLPRPQDIVERYPHELSGGMRQRVLMAAALVCEPEVLVADEPTTALDVTLQAQMLALVTDIVRARRLAVLWVTHDLGVVARIADRVAVMYAGRFVEQGPVDAVLQRPAHPYTRGLREAVVALSTAHDGPLPMLAGQPPRFGATEAGCPFRSRCTLAEPRCAEQVPRLRAVGRDGHAVSCHLAVEDA